MKNTHRLLATVTLASCIAAAAPASAQTLFTDRATFDAAAGSLETQDFDGSPTATGDTSITFGALTFSCDAGSHYCPSFFGTRTSGNGGSESVYFATPSVATFSFTSAITSFGIDVIGFGTAGSSDLTVTVGGVSTVVQSNYSSGNTFFVGLTSATPFTSLSFSGTAEDDGIDFDDASYHIAAVSSAVPEPATWAMMILGLGAVGATMRRRQKVATRVAYTG